MYQHRPAKIGGLKVAVAGSGGLGMKIARAIMAEGKHQVVILSRNDNTYLRGLGYPIAQVNYHSQQSIVAALKGVHTVISTIPNSAQLALLDACIAAPTVRRFAPAEYEGCPNKRPLVADDTAVRDKLTTILHLQQQTKLEWTIFVCGIFYEFFAPGGLIGTGATARAVCPDAGREGDFLVDFRNCSARLPCSSTSPTGDVTACFTSIDDVASFVTASISLPQWPRMLTMRGARITLRELVAIAQRVRGRAFQVAYINAEDLDEELFEIEDREEKSGEDMTCERLKIQSLQAVQDGEYDYIDASLNRAFPHIKVQNLEDWMRKVWTAHK